MKLSTLVPCMLGLIAIGCGTDQQSPAEENAPEAIESETQDAAAPEYFVAMVPLDENGEEINEQAQTRVVNQAQIGTIPTGDSSESLESNASIEAAFQQGEGITNKDELDADSSSQQYRSSYWYWRTGWYPGKWLGRGLWWGRNPYLYRGGHHYRYRYHNRYRHGGYYHHGRRHRCNYYIYRRHY